MSGKGASNNILYFVLLPRVLRVRQEAQAREAQMWVLCLETLFSPVGIRCPRKICCKQSKFIFLKKKIPVKLSAGELGE